MFWIFEIFGLIVAATAIAALARGRGASPFIAGATAVTGWIFFRFLAPAFVPPGEARFWLALPGSWAWVALVAGYLKFVVAVGGPKPDSKWNCANCRFLNNRSAIICEACQQPWQPSA